jgi:SWI/SNF-related matrix-associated actin-dependent regulator 1 of chromatin subfamily A
VNETLFEYQKEGAEWLSTKRFALLADEMGLGKSAQAITGADLIKAERILVLCPAVARITWLREFERFSTVPRKFSVLLSSKSPIDYPNSIITSYDLAAKLTIPGGFDLIILDESHFLKSTESQRSQSVWGQKGFCRRAHKIWCLSGTPAPSHAGDLWTMLYSFGATKLNYRSFVERFCTYYMFQGRTQITGSKSAMIPELKKLLKPFILRRRKDEVMRELPPIHFGSIVVERCPVDLEMLPSFVGWMIPIDRSKKLSKLLQTQEKLVESVLGRSGNSPHPRAMGAQIGTSSLRMLEAVAGSVSKLRMYTGLQKIDAVVELVTKELEAKAYNKIVIFAIHRDVIETLRHKLRKFWPATVYGGTDPHKKQKHVDRFQNNPTCNVFIGNIQAAGTNITLTAAHQVLFIEQSWVPGENAQAAMRCHRLGQKHPVTVRFVGLADSIDEKIMYVLKRKAKELTLIFDQERLHLVQKKATDLNDADSKLNGNAEPGSDSPLKEMTQDEEEK